MIAWIAVDWGTSNLRAWAMSATDTVLEARASDRGMGSLTPANYPAVLAALTEGWREAGRVLPAVICGMAGARQGWVEAPYLALPAMPGTAGAVTPPQGVEGLAVRILPGLSQSTPRPDVMRGEETQIAGVLRARPGFAGTVCLPGTHAKWVAVNGGAVTGFQTFMTGEIFALLAKQSVLRHGLAAEGWDAAVFGTAVDEALAAGGAIWPDLFALRAASLVAGLAPVAARSRLSGLLIGAELAAARLWWSDGPVIVVGMGGAAGLYADALKAQGAQVDTIDVGEATLAGLAAARAALFEGETA